MAFVVRLHSMVMAVRLVVRSGIVPAASATRARSCESSERPAAFQTCWYRVRQKPIAAPHLTDGYKPESHCGPLSQTKVYYLFVIDDAFWFWLGLCIIVALVVVQSQETLNFLQIQIFFVTVIIQDTP